MAVLDTHTFRCVASTAHPLPGNPSAVPEPAEGLATYGDLLTIASAHLAAAGQVLLTSPPPDRDTAHTELLATRTVLYALRAHSRLLVDGHRIDTVRQLLAPEPDDAAAVHLIDTLTAALRRRPDMFGKAPDRPGGVSAELLEAARSVRTAGDLVATHRDPTTGMWRGPDSPQLDDRRVRAVGIHRVAGLAAATVDNEALLRTRARRAGMTWRGVNRSLTDLAAVRATAADVLILPIDQSAAAFLDNVTVARPNVRTGHVTHELQDRLLRLRLQAWDLRQHPDHAPVDALTCIAAAAIAWHRAAETLRPESPRTLARPLTAWRTIHARLRRLATPAPTDQELSCNARAVIALLNGLGSSGGVSDPVLTVLDLGVAVFAEIATYNHDTLRRMSADGRLWMPARLLTGDDVSDHPELAAAKLRNHHVRAGPDRIDALLAGYEVAACGAHPQAPI